MNMKRLFGAFIAAFIFAFLFEWLLHGVILRGSEAALPQGLARAPADFQNHFAWVVLGIMFGIIYTGANLISYGVQPFPGSLVVWYSIAGLIEYAVAGAIVGTI